jgi:hypothetical protein
MISVAKSRGSPLSAGMTTVLSHSILSRQTHVILHVTMM